MPTYSACGVTATLCLADLETSVTKTIDLRTGALNRDVKRIEQVFAKGKSLREWPIGSDGSEKGVMQYIGDNENLPCFVVEASERSRPSTTREERAPDMESSNLPAFASSELPREEVSVHMTDSPLTSLAATPSTEANSTMPAASRCGTPSKSIPSLAPNDIQESPEHLTIIPLAQLHQLSAPRALFLEVQTCRKSFPPKINRKPGEMRFPDMKIELFLNGQLADTHFVNYQRSGTDHKHKFTGTRIHKQIAKPWVYQELGQRESREMTAEQRWSGVSTMLLEQAKLRGVDKHDELPPAAQYLSALANLALPDRLKDCAHLGVFDIIITTGKGSKRRPIHGYLTSPRAMLSTKFGVHSNDDTGDIVEATVEEQEQDDPFTDTQLLVHSTRATTISNSENPSAPVSFNSLPPAKQAADSSELSSEQVAQSPPSTSPAIPLARRTRSAAVDDNALPSMSEFIHETPDPANPQPAKSRLQPFAEKLGIPPEKMTMARQWHSKRGKLSMCKTVTERLNDIRKMSVENQEVAIAEVLDAISSSDAPPSPVNNEPPRKKARKDSKCQTDQDVTMQDVLDDPVARAAQQRMDMLIDQGATPNGRLAGRVSSLSSHRKPTKKAALPPAMAPPPVLGKLVPQDAKLSPEKKPQAATSGNHDSEAMASALSTPQIQEQSDLATGNLENTEAREQDTLEAETPDIPAATSHRKKAKGKRRAASTATQDHLPNEPTGEDALAAFQPPELCRGSVLTYAGPGMQRQTAKSRPGIFDEDELVVGMRFVVI